MNSMRYRVMLLGLAVPALLVAQQPDQQLPRFRAGANLVRVDAYVSKDNVALTDLTAADFTVFEDDKPQQIESFSLIQARRPNPQTERTDPTTVRDMQQQAADSARLFTLFFDRWSVQVSGSYRAVQSLLVDHRLLRRRLSLVDELDATPQVEAEARRLREDHEEGCEDQPGDDEQDEDVAAAIAHGTRRDSRRSQVTSMMGSI